MIISEEQAHAFKLFFWGQLPIEVLNKMTDDMLPAINKMIDLATTDEAQIQEQE